MEEKWEGVLFSLGLGVCLWERRKLLSMVRDRALSKTSSGASWCWRTHSGA